MFGSKADERLAAIEKGLKKLADAQRDHATTSQAQLVQLEQRQATQATSKDLRLLLEAVRDLEKRVEHAEDRRLQDAGSTGRRRLDEKRLRRRLEQIAAADGPILIGPWTGEVGFELLYWAPFVRWVREEYALAPDRLFVVSRGGVESWYEVPRARYGDALSLVTPAEFRDGVAQERLKQRRAGAFDQHLAAQAAARLDLGAAESLHPALMYRMFMPFWRDQLGVAHVERFARFARLLPPEDALPAGLPADYVAVRFYFSDAFPDSPANRAFARNAVESLAAHTAVLLLNPQLALDDHADWMPAPGDRVFTLAAAMTPERNLAVQSRAIAGARAYVGTYGGYAYLAPFLGVPAIAFHSARSFKLHHLHMAQRALERIGQASVTAVDVADAAVVQAALGAVEAVRP